MEDFTKSSNITMRISQVFQLTSELKEEKKLFYHNSILVNRIRLFGIIVSKFDKFDSENLVSSFITLDDGNATISIRFWMNENYFDKILISHLHKIQVGDICEVAGRPREYQNERYLLLDGISKPKSIDWEIKQRLLRLKYERTSQKKVDQVSKQTLSILDHFKIDYNLNSISLLSERTNLNSEEVQNHLKILYNEGYIILPIDGYYKKVD